MTIHHHLDTNSGAAGSTLALAEEYRCSGHEVEIFSHSDLPAALGRLKTQLLFPFYVARHLRQRLRHSAVDIVDASTADAWFWARFYRPRRQAKPAFITRSTGLEHVGQLEARGQVDPRPLRKRLVTRANTAYNLWTVAASLRTADCCIFLNRVDRDYAVEHLKVARSRAHIVGNGIPAAYMSLDFEESSGAEWPLHIAVIGSFIPRKGTGYAIAALTALLNRYPQLYASFLGTGYAEDVVRVEFPAEMQERVRVVPQYKREELPHLLKGHQIQIFASISEGFGKTLLEGMACGLAPVTTDTPGPLEIVRDGHDAVVVPRADAAAIESAVEGLIADRTRLSRIRRHAYETAQHFGWDGVAAKRLAVYEAALQGRTA